MDCRQSTDRRFGFAAIGSGGPYALAAARALLGVPGLDAATIGGAFPEYEAADGCYCKALTTLSAMSDRGVSTAERAMNIAADCCIYTNHNFSVQKLEAERGLEQIETTRDTAKQIESS